MSKELVEALQKLACLGNGDRPGNSEGNIIAQEALRKYEAQQAEIEPVWSMPSYGVIPWASLIAAIGEATGAPWQEDKSYYVGHQMAGINMNSLNRIVSKFAARPQPTIPEGWKLVPIEPTDEMLDWITPAFCTRKEVYQHLLEAAPEPKK
jgi:hypothetical protein